ncbi:MAG TPA: PepSY-associated TM helix domain-containing protein [Caulobacteraceae bacterium]|nr:PepSY-associated TM helix domain-containing protein [Caulobacteraceae bacterium]
MRTFHRILAIVTVLLMLYLGVTGTAMQLIDMVALATHQPDNAADIASINEGRYGNGSIHVITDGDLVAAPLPAGVDYNQAFAAVLQDLHKAAPGAQPRFVELRQVDGRTIGQVDLGAKPPAPGEHAGPPSGPPRPGFRRGGPGQFFMRDTHIYKAFDLQTGAPVKPVVEGELHLPPSARETLKEWHRFWQGRDTPGVWYELGSGILLWSLIITGLWQYFQLLAARRKIGREQLFWMGGGVWKSLHRIISVTAAVFLICIAFSGTWLGFESVYHTFSAPKGGEKDVTEPLGDAQVLQIVGQTVTALKTLEPGAPIKVLRARHWGGMNQGGVVLGGAHTRQVLINADTGKIASLTEAGYPNSGFPWGTERHENIKHFHSGMMLGWAGRIGNLIGGLSLIYLSISGIIMYVDLWLRRRKGGKKVLFWV